MRCYSWGCALSVVVDIVWTPARINSQIPPSFPSHHEWAVSPVLKWDPVWRWAARRADVDARQNQDGGNSGECNGKKRFRHYGMARRKMNVVVAIGGVMDDVVNSILSA